MATTTPSLTGFEIGDGVTATPTLSLAYTSSAVSSPVTLLEAELYGLGANDPLAPTSLQVDGQSNPTLSVANPWLYKPKFTAVYNDPDVSDVADQFQIQVSTDQTFVDVSHWNSGSEGTAMSNVTEGNRSSDLTYAGSALAFNTPYYWRVRFWDDEGHVGLWSTETASFTLEQIVAEVRVLGSTRFLGSVRAL